MDNGPKLIRVEEVVEGTHFCGVRGERVGETSNSREKQRMDSAPSRLRKWEEAKFLCQLQPLTPKTSFCVARHQLREEEGEMREDRIDLDTHSSG